MKIRAKAVIQSFNLTTDPDGEAVVTVRQAREGETQERNDMLSTVSRVYESRVDNALMKLEQSVNRRKLMRKEAYLTLANVTGVVTEDGEEVFKSKETVDGPSVRGGMSETAFNLVWDRLPPEVATEIVSFVYAVNPTWDPDNLGE